MTIDVPAELLTASSGSAGDVVHSHNQHGPYQRPRTTPTDPATALQVVVRDALAECVTAWNATLTQAEREAWDRYALAVPATGRTGRSNNVGGLGAFVRANVPRIQAPGRIIRLVTEAPTLLDSASPSPIPRIVLNTVDDTIHPFWNAGDAWACETRAAMLFYVSAPTPLTRHFWAGPYRYAGMVLGVTPPIFSPGSIPLPLPAAPGQRVFVRARVTRADARLSPPITLPADTVPPVAPVFASAAIEYGIGATMYLNVSFTDYIKTESHNPAFWRFRYNDYLFYPTIVRTHAGGIRLQAVWGPHNPGLDTVWYFNGPTDTHGLLTGLPVALFWTTW